MSFQSLSRILPRAIQTAGIERQVTASRVVEEAQATLVRLWGEEKAAYVQAVSFSDGILKLQSAAGAAVQELRHDEMRLLNELNRRLGSRAVFRLQILSV